MNRRRPTLTSRSFFYYEILLPPLRERQHFRNEDYRKKRNERSEAVKRDRR